MFVEFNNKNFPYPVLTKNSDDYVNSEFSTVVDYELIDTKIKFKLNYLIENKELTDLLSEGKISVIYHIECPQTSFRKAIKVQSKYETHEINETFLNGKVEVSTFIAVTEPIVDYSNSSFNEMFRSYLFDFEIGSILAIGNQYNFLINKETEELVNVASIFKLVKNEQIQAIEYDASKDRILVYVPANSFVSYSILREIPTLQTVLSGLIIVPVLSSVLTEIASGKGSGYEDNLWYLSLEKQLKERFKTSLSVDDLSSYGRSMVHLAQELIGHPTTKGINTLKKDYTGENIKGDTYE